VDKTAYENKTLIDIAKRLAATEKWRWPHLPCDYLVIDLETLALSAHDGHVVQVGMCAVRDCKPVHDLWGEDYTQLVLKWPKEAFVGHEEAIKVHGIDFARSQKEGVDPKEVFGIVADIIGWAKGQGMMIVGHNLFRFDLPYLKIEMAHYNLDLNVKQEEVLDTGVFVKGMQVGSIPGDTERLYEYCRRIMSLPVKGVRYNLANYCVQRFGLGMKYNISSEKAHDAGYDCYLTHLVIQELNKIILDSTQTVETPF